MGIDAQRFTITSTGAASKVSGEFRVNQLTLGNQSNPTIERDAQGGFVVAWQSENQDTSGFGIDARRYNSAAVPLANKFRVNTTIAGDQLRPAITVDSRGAFVVAWSGNGSGDSDGIFVQRYDAAAAKIGSKIRANDQTNGNQSQPSVGLDCTGNFVVVWSGDGPGDVDAVFARQFLQTTRVAEVRVAGISRGLIDGGSIVLALPASAGLSVQFSRPVDAITAQNPANYLVEVDTGLGSVPVPVTTAVLTANTVTLSLASRGQLQRQCRHRHTVAERHGKRRRPCHPDRR